MKRVYRPDDNKVATDHDGDNQYRNIEPSACCVGGGLSFFSGARRRAATPIKFRDITAQQAIEILTNGDCAD
jgi:hypothetical protein